MYFPRLSANEGINEDRNEDLTAEAEFSETILVVEDDTDVRTYLAETLRVLGYQVLTTNGAQGALAILAQHEKRVDLLLTDVVMPGLNGRDLGKRAQALRPGLAVLYMTGYSRNAVIHQGRLDEGVDLLQKPISQGALAARIRSILDKSQS
jgi:CheY-like chemotaxis protein